MAFRSGQHFELELPEAHLRRPAGVDLQRDDARARARRIVELDARLVVEPRAHLRARALDHVAVPAVERDLRGAAVDEQPAPVLLVELAPPAGADVGLVALDLAVLERLRPELDAAVPLVAGQAHLDAQAEVAELEVAREEGVALEALGAADDLGSARRSRLDAPH